MSADNGIYILESKDGFRVIYAQAIENIFNAYPELGFNEKWLKEYFGDTRVLSSRDEAWEEALRIQREQPSPTEYGIRIIPGHEGDVFPV